MSAVDVLTLGETMISFRTPGLAVGAPATVHVAGAESNVAIGLARLGHRARWVGTLSADALGDLVAETLASEGVDTAFVRRDASRSASAMVLEAPRDQARRATYLRRGAAGAQLTSDDALAALAAGARWVHVTGITPALSASARSAWLTLIERAAAVGIAVCLDVNFRGQLWSREDARAALAQVVGWVTTLVASDDELDLVASGTDEDALVSDLLDRGVREVVVTRGERGASAYRRGEVEHAAAIPVRAVDAIGAGDALTAGFLSGQLDGLGLAECLARGVRMGAACVASAGDWEGLPTRAGLGTVW